MDPHAEKPATNPHPRVLHEAMLDKVAGGGDTHKETIEVMSWSLGATNPSSARMVKVKP